MGSKSLTASQSYLVCGVLVAISHGCGSVAMVYLNFTTAALFKSAKVPATLLGGFFQGADTSKREFVMAVGMASGLFVFGIAERYESPRCIIGQEASSECRRIF